MPPPIGQSVEILCFLLAIRCFYRGERSYWKWFIWFMLITVIVEILGYTLPIDNYWMYNLYLLVEIVFKFYVLYRICKPYFSVQYLALACLLVFVAFYLYESINSGFLQYSVQSNAIASIQILIICCCYYYYFLKKEEYVDIYKHAPFWVVTGLFFFYLGSSAANPFFNYLATINQKQGIPVRYIIMTVLSVILYGCWSYAFLCRYRKTTSSS
jgi:hypothetical protein